MSAFGALQQANLDAVVRATAFGALDGAMDGTFDGGSADPYLSQHGSREASSVLDDLGVAIESMLDGIMLIDERSLLVVAANSAAAALLGCSVDTLVGRNAMVLAATPEDAYFWADPAEQRDGELLSESLIVRDDGAIVPVLRRIARVSLPDGTLFMVSLRDRTEQQRVEDELELLVAELSATLESTADALLAIDLSGRIRGFNRHFAALWALPEELTARRDDAAIEAWMESQVADPAAYQTRLRILGDEVIERARDSLEASTDVFTLVSGQVLERVTVPQRSRGVVTGRVYSFRDISERVAAQQRIETLSHTDALTGLPNRRLLGERMTHALAVAKRDATTFAVLFLDLDRFKHINDTFGHAFGDRVLLETTERLQGCLRQVDMVARPSGDEFVLTVHEADTPGAEAAARRVIDAMNKPFVLDGISFTVTCSIGIAMYPADGADMEALLRSADMAMYEVKSLGRAGYRFFQPGKEVDLRNRVKLDHAMRQALVAGNFSLHYQPQVDLQSGAVTGAEALLRWHDPVLGEIPPHEFFPLAEESGFIVALCDWALTAAIAQAASWNATGHPMRVSVNISALQFHRSNFVGNVAAALAEHALPAGLLELELTEAILLQDADEALRRLRELGGLGVQLSIDDFGAGYSSLSYLKRFPVQRLKIDASFVMGVPHEESDMGIVRAIVNLARSLHLSVIAEGVEVVEQRAFLIDAGCDEYQGFLFSPALRVADFEALLRRT